MGDLLRQKKATVLGRWSRMVCEAYPAETGAFLQARGDRFANPVGHTIARTTEAVYDALADGTDLADLSEPLEALVRIRAVQDFSPAQAVGFVFDLKQVIRQELDDEIQANGIVAQLLPLESRIDEVALLAFDLYAQCRQQLYDLRIAEVKRQTQMLSRGARRDR